MDRSSDQLAAPISSWFFYFAIGIIWMYRFFVLYMSSLNLHFDEAQYWLWAQQLEWGYFSKPPIIAWGIALQQWLFGEDVVVLKSLALFVYPLTTGAIYATARYVYDREVAIYSALLFFTMPAVSLASFIISTDVFLLLFWALSVWIVTLAMDSERLDYWLWAGFFAGCGLLTKYTMLLFLPSVVLVLYLRGQLWHRCFSSPAVMSACVIALLVWLPNLLWNLSHGMASFRHLYEISQVEKQRFHFFELASFLGAQIGVLGLFSTLLFIRYCLSNCLAVRKDRIQAIWFGFFIVFFLVISGQAFLSRAFANWAAPCYVTAVIWLSSVLVRSKKIRLLNIAILVNLATMCAMYHYEMIYTFFSVPLTAKSDPLRVVRGWDMLGKEVSVLLRGHPDRFLLSENRKILSELIYYVQPHPFDALLFNPRQEIKNHFHLKQDMNQFIGADFIWVSRQMTTKHLLPYFSAVRYLKTVSIPSYQASTLNYYIYYLDGFKGYAYE